MSSSCSARDFLGSKFTRIMQPDGAQRSCRGLAAESESRDARWAARGCAVRGSRAARLHAKNGWRPGSWSRSGATNLGPHSGVVEAPEAW